MRWWFLHWFVITVTLTFQLTLCFVSQSLCTVLLYYSKMFMWCVIFFYMQCMKNYNEKREIGGEGNFILFAGILSAVLLYCCFTRYFTTAPFFWDFHFFLFFFLVPHRYFIGCYWKIIWVGIWRCGVITKTVLWLYESFKYAVYYMMPPTQFVNRSEEEPLSFM